MTLGKGGMYKAGLNVLVSDLEVLVSTGANDYSTSSVDAAD